MAETGPGDLTIRRSEVSEQFPKVIWLLWLQGWDQAPEIVKACLQTWRRHNPTWRIETLDARTVREFLDSDAVLFGVIRKEIPHAALSDVIRIALLRRYGGVWADSTTYCLKPLDYWLDEHLGGGFFAFAKPAPGLMLSSWFLAATSGNYMIELWYRATASYWAERAERDDYFWFHRLFEQTYQTDTQFRAAWDSVPRLPADGPHYYVPYEAKLRMPVTPADVELIENPPVPLLKLTHWVAPADCPRRSVSRYLYARADGRRRPSHQFLAHDGLEFLRSRVWRAITNR